MKLIARTPIDNVGYDLTSTVEVAGQVLAVTLDPDSPGKWCVWTLSDPDEIPAQRRLVMITTGLALPEGEWKYLNLANSTAYVWHVFVEETAS